MRNKLISAIFLYLFLFSLAASGQKLINTPYSRFNIGSLEQAASFRSLSMGGTGIGLRSSQSIYFANPASFSAIDTNSFIFDFGMDYGLNKLSDGVNSYTSEDMNFNHLLLGFPIKKGWGASLGIVPVSSGFYNISEKIIEGDPGYDPLVGPYASTHNGDGGFNKFYIGSGINITKNLSAGINMNLIFGQVRRYYQISFSDYASVYHMTSSEKLMMHGISLDYGLQYNIPLKNDYFINAGISLSTARNYKTDFEELSYKYTIYDTRDTISIVSDDSTKTHIPGTLSLGVSFGKKNKFTAAFDFVMTKWSDSRIPGLGNYAADTRTYRVGIEFIPDKYSNASLLKRFEYRAGAHLGDNYLILNNEQIKEYGASLGLGLPLRRTFSRVNLYFDYTRRNGPDGTLKHLEDYYTMGISLNLYDFWFLKRKYE
jgi:hypothetical protein